MASIERNAPCPCGSGKRYKHCHGAAALLNQESASSVQSSYRITSILFSPELRTGGQRLVVNGSLFVGKDECPFMMILQPLSNDEWQISQFGWKDKRPTNFDRKALGELLIRATLSCLQVFDAEAAGEDGLEWRPINPGEGSHAHRVGYRPILLRVQSPDWLSLWDRIETRVGGDAALEMPGFSQETIRNALHSLKPVFPVERIKKFYQDAKGKEARMTSELTPANSHGWFPAFHLAGLASGVICADPAWPYLLDLGLAVATLKQVKGRPVLLEKVAVRPALHHHVCFAAELHLDGLLDSVADSGDLLTKPVNGSTYRIRTRAIDRLALWDVLPTGLPQTASKDHAAAVESLKNLLQETAAQATDQEPMILHLIAHGGGWYNQANAATDAQLAALAPLPPAIGAVVVSHRFVNAEGGHVQRRTHATLLNQDAQSAVQAADIDRLFNRPTAEIKEPCLNSGDYYLFRSDN